MIYTSCNDLPLARFIRCMCDKDYTALVIEGEASADKLQEAWEKIYQEYIELSGPTQDNYALSLTVEVSRLSFRLLVITESVNQARQYYFPEGIKLLRSLGYNFRFNYQDQESYHNDLDRVLRKSKSIELEKQQKQRELDLMQSAGKGKEVNRQYFDKILSVLSKFSTYYINEELITVSRYVSILNLYIDHVNELNAHHGRQGR